MPTASKAAAAFFFAALAYVVSDLIIPLFEEQGRPFHRFHLINCALGALIGWRVVGRRAGLGRTTAIGIGVTGGAALGIVGLFTHASAEMIKLSLRKIYDGPAEAVVAVFEIGLKFGAVVATPEVIGALLIGGAIGGVLTEAVNNRAN